MAELEDAVAKFDGDARGEVAVAQYVAQEWGEPLVHEDTVIAQVVSQTPLGQAGVEIAGDVPVTRKFLLQRN